MAHRRMFLGLTITDGYGSNNEAWRRSDVDPSSYTNLDVTVRHAQAAERGGFAFLFTPDFPAVRSDVARFTLQNTMDPMLTLTAIARETERIGLVATGSTTFQEPFNLARQFKALDVISHGRAGWNAVTTSDPYVAANYGRPVAERGERYRRAHEMVQIVQALWGSWGRAAWVKDQESGEFIDMEHLRPIDLQGEYVASRGPLAIPPSEQGQPVVFSAGGPSPDMLALAGRYSNAFITEVWTIPEARAQRAAVRDAAEQAGRDPDEIKFVVGLMTTIAPTVREGLDRRLSLAGDVIPQRVPQLGQMLGLRLDPGRLDEPLTAQELSLARPSSDPRSESALEVARQGWSVRDVLAHGVIDYHPVTVGPGEVHADHLQEWFEADAADGFWISPDMYNDGVDAFVDEVVPILRDRGIYPTDYEGVTLRDHLGLPDQYGIDPRVLHATAS
jgi:FMN-dependent oxidoreductase (nitrilotriacetate monooxygenase family)